LVELLIDGAAALDLELASPRRADERGGSIMLRLPASCDAAKLTDALRAKQLYVDCRGQILRLSPGNLTTTDGAARLLRALRDALGR
jgi:kynureninase